MNAPTTLLQSFGQTTIDTRQVEDFLLGIPRYREAGYQIGVGSLAGRLLFRTDVFEFELRQHLAGETKTRYHLNRSIRAFLTLDDYAARHMVRFSLDAVRDKLLQNEWYEVMPRYEKTRQHIHKTFNI